jgi:diacylglycerol kinase (ATP)
LSTPTSPPPAGAAARPVLVVFNPGSATFDRENLEAALAAAFEPSGRPVLRFALDREDDCGARLARAVSGAVDDHADLVLAAGGDGTISMVADALAPLDAEQRPLLGLVPQGTANVLARELEVPIDTARAVRLAATTVANGGRVVHLDAMRVNGRVFLTQVGAGLDARMIEATSHEEQRRSGRWAYMRSLLREMSGWRSHRFVLILDGRRVRRRAWEVLIANARTMGTPPFTWGPEIAPDDGVLDVGVYDVRNLGDWLLLVLRFLTGRHRTDQRARYYRFRRVLRIETRHPVPVQGDGDLIGTTPIEVAIEPRLLRVVAGPDDATEAEAAVETVARAQAARPQPVVAAEPGAAAAAAGRAAQAVRIGLWHRLAGVDHAVYRWVNRLHAWPPATQLARILSRTMDHGELWVAIALAVAAFRSTHPVVAMLVLIACIWLTELTINFPIKSAFRRQRPFVAFEDAKVHVERLPRDWSFPSGHSATAFAGAVLLTPVLPPLAPLFFAYAAAVALSRVYLGVHYPVDVLLGGAVGMGLALVYATMGRALLG